MTRGSGNDGEKGDRLLFYISNSKVKAEVEVKAKGRRLKA